VRTRPLHRACFGQTSASRTRRNTCLLYPFDAGRRPGHCLRQLLLREFRKTSRGRQDLYFNGTCPHFNLLFRSKPALGMGECVARSARIRRKNRLRNSIQAVESSAPTQLWNQVSEWIPGTLFVPEKMGIAAQPSSGRSRYVYPEYVSVGLVR